MEPIETVTMGAEMASNLSAWTLFMQADIIVKAVMVALVMASFWCWAIIFDKLLRVRTLNAQADKFEEAFWSGGSLDDLYERLSNRTLDPMSAVFVAAMREWRRAAQKGLARGQTAVSLGQRIDRVMHVAVNRETDRLYRRVGFLASTGSVAPFIGLFGTVWGIMSSFHAIGMTKNTSLAVVAPGIAEALFATALGLVAAIPAVIAYNKISTDLGRYAQRLDDFSGEFSAILSRQLEERG